MYSKLEQWVMALSSFVSRLHLSTLTATAWLSLIIVVNLALVVPGLMVLRPISFVKWLLNKRKAITPRQRFLRELADFLRC